MGWRWDAMRNAERRRTSYVTERSALAGLAIWSIVLLIAAISCWLGHAAPRRTLLVLSVPVSGVLVGAGYYATRRRARTRGR